MWRGSKLEVDQLTFTGLVGECTLEAVCENDWTSVSRVPPWMGLRSRSVSQRNQGALPQENECWPSTHIMGRTCPLKSYLTSPLTLETSGLLWLLLSFCTFTSLHKWACGYMIMVPFQYTVQWNLLQSIFGSVREGNGLQPALCQELYSRPNFHVIKPSLPPSYAGGPIPPHLTK